MNKFALGLMLLGVVMPFVLWLISERLAEVGFMVSVLMLLITCVMGMFGFRQPLGKITTFGSIAILLVYAALMAHLNMARVPIPQEATPEVAGNSREVETRKPRAFVPPSASPAPVRPRTFVPPSAPTVPVDQVFRKAFAAANASDGIEFAKHMGQSWSFYEMQSTPSGRPMQWKHKNLDILGMMELFIGDIVTLKFAESLEGRYGPEAYVTLRKRDGSIAYLIVEFDNIGGKWMGIHARRPNFKTISRIEFQPPQGDAEKILMTHLGFGEESRKQFLRPVAGKPGQFDLISFAADAESAKNNADGRIEKLRESLKKFSLEIALKVISPAVMPEAPYMSEDAPPFVEPKP